MHLPPVSFLLQADATGDRKSLTFDTPVGDLPVVGDARWSEAFTHHSWAALLVWVVLLFVLQAVTWPLVRRVFARFPDRGWGFARLITTLIAGYMVWLLASVELISFRAVWCGVAVAITALGSIGVWWLLRHGSAREELLRPWRSPAVVASELVFWVTFGIFLAFRLINPDSYHPIWGGEKAMEFAHINAILRSAHFPPVDPWYSGGFINYYYYGEYLVAFLVKLTGIPTEIAFNLAQPTIVAFLASGAFSVAAAFGKRFTRSRNGAIGAGLAGVVLVSFAGNLVELARLVDRMLHGQPFVDGFSYWFWAPSRAVPDPNTQHAITEFPYFSATYADLHAHVVALPITVLAIGLVYALALEWRAVAVAVTIPRLSRKLIIDLAVRLSCIALVLGALWPTNAWDLPMYAVVSGIGMLMATRGIVSLWRRLVVAGAALAAVGIVSYLMILPFLHHYVALFSSVEQRDADTPLVSVESHFGVFFVIAFVGMMTLLARNSRLPRYLASPVLPLIALGIVLLFRWYAVGRGEGVIQLADSLTVLVIVSSLAVACFYGAPVRSDLRLPSVLPRMLPVVGRGAVVILLLIDRPVPALYLGFGLVAVALWLSLPDTTERFIAAMFAGGMLLGSALEVVFLVDDLSGSEWYRMNTVFKFYNQLWILFALGSAGLVGKMAAEFVSTRSVSVERVVPIAEESLSAAGTVVDHDVNETDDRTVPTRKPAVPFGWFGWSGAGLIASLLMVIASLAYPLNATAFRLDQHFSQPGAAWTLDSYDWMRYGEIQYSDGSSVGYKDDRAAIDWANDHIHGTPVIAEASFGTYRCNGSRFSIATGLPDVIGWKRHEEQQRYQDDLATRESDLRDLYTTPDVARKQAIIQQYGIGYVFVGETERKYPSIQVNDCVVGGSAEGIAAIEGMVGTDLEVAFTSGTTTIYRVISGT
jgi:YYY domain-containing protein